MASQDTAKSIEPLASQMGESREKEAVAAYFAFLVKRGANAGQLSHRLSVLLSLDNYLHGITNDGAAYRDAVEAMLEKTPKVDWPYSLSVVREFFLFWTQNFKLIAKLSAEEHFDLELAQWQALQGDLKVLWQRLDKDVLKERESRMLSAYTDALQHTPQLQAAAETRRKLAKLLLVRLADTPNRTPKLYRKAVDATMPVFEMKEMRFLFLEVVRELFYFWIEDPEAVSHLQRSHSENPAFEL